MNIIEFQNRVNVNVTPDEYEHIDAVYMASDMEKDEFCAMWRKMNASRVRAAKEYAHRRAKLEKIIDRIMFDPELNGGYSDKLAINYFTYDEQDTLESLGIEMTYTTEYGITRCYSIADIRREIFEQIAA